MNRHKAYTHAGARLFDGNRGFLNSRIATPRLLELRDRYAALVQRVRPGEAGPVHVFNVMAEIDAEILRREGVAA